MFGIDRRDLIAGAMAVLFFIGAQGSYSWLRGAPEPSYAIKAQLPQQFDSFVAFTDAGMLALWDPARFSNIVSYDDFAAELEQDESLLSHIKQGTFVPIYLRRDGAFQFVVRIITAGSEELTDREARYRLLSSEPYLFISKGKICLSGLEHIGPKSRNGRMFDLAPGRHEVTIHLLDWSKEPGATGTSGEPLPHALPDFLVVVRPETAAAPAYREKLLTFEPLAASR